MRVEDLEGKDYSFSIKQTAHGVAPAASHFKVTSSWSWCKLVSLFSV